MREQAEQCGEMLRRLGALAEAETDEATLRQALELHSALEQAMGQYDVLLAVAEARLPLWALCVTASALACRVRAVLSPCPASVLSFRKIAVFTCSKQEVAT